MPRHPGQGCLVLPATLRRVPAPPQTFRSGEVVICQNFPFVSPRPIPSVFNRHQSLVLAPPPSISPALLFGSGLVESTPVYFPGFFSSIFLALWLRLPCPDLTQELWFGSTLFVGPFCPATRGSRVSLHAFTYLECLPYLSTAAQLDPGTSKSTSHHYLGPYRVTKRPQFSQPQLPSQVPRPSFGNRPFFLEFPPSTSILLVVDLLPFSDSSAQSALLATSLSSITSSQQLLLSFVCTCSCSRA
ncbi:hypothetical protein B0T09DRAFT_118364 [Sordaria sp. MPI-SDFR-AT-0083]|nr:hypothetical protein B0T09DRAFT_118364 [Sordaria sp. MPI-SDFR-AT-0083]